MEGSHLDPNFYVKKLPHLEDEDQKLEIYTPDPLDEEEAESETEPIRNMRNQMRKLN